jgi:hypothetical protein
LFEGGGFGFQIGVLPPYDFHYHLAYYREFEVTDRIAPGFIVTGGFGFSNGKPGFGAKIGGHLSIILAEDVRIGAQFFIAYAFGKYYDDSDSDPVIERKNILHIPINVFFMWGF